MADPPPSGPLSSPPPHRAPPLDTRPRAPIAMWALGLSILLGAIALFSGLWIALAPALLLAAAGVLRIRPQERRGQGMALVALVLSLMVGSCSFLNVRNLHGALEGIGHGVLTALASEEPGRLDDWIPQKDREAGAADRIRKRYAAAVEALGPYRGEVGTGSLLLGASSLVLAPKDATEFGREEGAKPAGTDDLLWVTAAFERGSVRLGILLAGDDQVTRSESLVKVIQDGKAPVVSDLRFFRADEP